MKKIFNSFLLVFLLSQNNFSFSFSTEKGDSTVTLSISEVPVISAGAEYSSMLQEAINSGNYSLADFHNQIKNPISPKGTGLQEDIFTIEGINFEEEATLGAFFHIPPDPIGAAGPSHIVSVVNTSIQWFTKLGVNENSQRLGKNITTAVGSFFETLLPLTATFDPKVIYDQYDERFIVVTLEKTDTANGDSINTSRILIAVSNDNNPNGTWHFHSIDSKISISSVDHWADYPGLAVDNEAIYITANMFEFEADGNDPGGIRLWIINKTPLYSGGAGIVSIYDPFTAAGVADFASTTQPAHMFGSPPGGVGTFLTYYSGLSDGTAEYVGVIRVDDPFGTPSFVNQFVLAGNIDITATATLPDAPQKDISETIEVNDRRALNAVWRDNYLWITTTLLPSSGVDMGQTTAHWFKISTTILALLLVSDQGNIGGEDIAPGTYTFFPSLAVNENGNMVIGFSASAPTIYPGAYFAGRLSTDPSGTVSSSGILRSGQDFYIRKFGGSSNRWGDYSGISVDPSNDDIFWIFNEYARTRGNVISGEDGRWGTAFGEVPLSVVNVANNETGSTENLSFKLEQNYPNPFNPNTSIQYAVGSKEFVSLKVHDVLGREVATLVNEENPAGTYVVEFNANRLSSGIYFYTLEVVPFNGEKGFKKSRKMILMK